MSIYFWDEKVFIPDKKNNYEIDINDKKIIKRTENNKDLKYIHIYNRVLDNIPKKFDMINGNISDDLILFNNFTNSINIIECKNNNINVIEKIFSSFDIKHHGIAYCNNVFVAFSEDEFIILSNEVKETVHKSKNTLYYNKIRLMNFNNRQYVFCLISSKKNQFFSEVIKYSI